MQLTRILFESHSFSATVYVAGFLGHVAADSVLARLEKLAPDTRIIRLDLRGVNGIDAEAFVRIARALNRWRAIRRGRVNIVFPKRSERPPVQRHLQLVDQNPRMINELETPVQRHLQLVDQNPRMINAVSTAMTWPMSTSPG